MNLEIKDEYSNMNCFEYKYYCFVKIVLSCLKPNHYDRPDFSGMIKFLSKDVQERISKQKNDGDFPEQENSPSKKREIKLNELIEKYNKAYGCFEKRQDKETGNLIKTTLLKMENDEELIRRAKTNEYAD
ncbi:hypothetical protein FACS189459_2350 [Bacilli bacterium]|nr:hypothetical protein FACS189459_2350 [Bacilli bacterium]